jgi:hypothetical protein
LCAADWRSEKADGDLARTLNGSRVEYIDALGEVYWRTSITRFTCK